MTGTRVFSLGHAFSSAPWAIPALVATLVISLLLHRRLAKSFHTSPWFVLAFMLCLGSILSITLTPGDWHPAPYCSLRVVFPRPADLFSMTERSLNIWLFAPLGLLLAFTPRPRLGALFFAAAMLLPFMIEGLQLVVPGIGRSCQVTDIINNLIGLFLGGTIGLSARIFWLGMTRSARRKADQTSQLL
jgi:VanZ family protein